VNVDDAQIVDLHVKDEDLANVLEMLSIQSQKNIIASKEVQARVTANLYGVTFYEALDAILHVNGYGYVEDGNFVKVYTLEELEKITQAQRQKVSKVLFLNYLSSVDASEFVKPLLSVEGQIKVNGKVDSFPSLGDVPVGNEQYAHSSMLVVYDYPENVTQIEEMIRQLDTKPAQVLVEATILQTQLNEANALGVDFSVLADMSFSEFTSVGPLAAAQTMAKGFVEDSGSGGGTGGGTGGGAGAAGGGKTRVPAGGGGTAISQTVGQVQSGNGGMKIGIVSNDVAVFLRVLDEVSDTTVVSNPKVLALNRQPARVLVGRKVGYLNTTTTDTATTQTVEFLDTGTQLYFRPFVSNDGIIRMELRPAVSEAAIRTASDVSGANITIPDEITNELVTNVMVRDGQTIVLGGLFRESTTVSRKQVPFLGDIPILGNAFRGHDDQTNRNEIIFLITPTIVNDDALAEAGKRSIQYMDNVLTGAREGVLPWSRDRLTGSMNVEAEKLARDGKVKEALYNTDRSLRLNPNQPSMVALRERLAGESRDVHNRSFLERVLHGEMATTYRASDASRRNRLDQLLNNLPSNTESAVASQPIEASSTEQEVFTNEVPQPQQPAEPIQFADVPEQHVSAEFAAPQLTQPQFDLLGTAPGYVEPATNVSELSNALAVAEAVGEPTYTSPAFDNVQDTVQDGSQPVEQTFASSSFESVEASAQPVEQAAPAIEVASSDSSETEVDAVVDATFDGNAQAFAVENGSFEAVQPAEQQVPAIEVSSSDASQQVASDAWTTPSSEGATQWQQSGPEIVPQIEVSSSQFENFETTASGNDLLADLSVANNAAATQVATPAVSRNVRVPAPTGFNGMSPAWYMVMNRYYNALGKAQQNTNVNLDAQHAFTNVTNEPNQPKD